MGVYTPDPIFYGGLNLEFKPSKFDSTTDDEAKLKIYKAELPGVSKDRVLVQKKWVNRTKTMYLHITIHELNNKFHEEDIKIDTDIYDSYSVNMEDGLLIITLHEIINEQPKFEEVN